MKLQPAQIDAIVSLLSDPDPDIAASLRQKLHNFGEETVRLILQSCVDGSRAHREASRVLMRFKEPSLDMRFRNLAINEYGDIALEDGVFALARFGYPDLDESAYKTRLGHMAFELAPRVAPDDHPIRIIRTLNQYLFDEQGFYTPNKKIFDFDDTYINRVLDRKRGWPITLSVVYLILAQRLELPIVGVALPEHYIVKYSADESDIYIDPFNRGQILTANECAELTGTELTDEFFEETSNRFTLFRMMNNLRVTLVHSNHTQKAQKLEKLISFIQEDLPDI